MNKYEVIELLGEGSFGRVYKAKCLSTCTFVALKVICKRGRSSKEVKGLRRECEIQKHLDHPNIIKMLDSFETENEIVVITEFAHKALNTILWKEGYLSEEKVQKIVWDLVSALYYLHSHRVLHRDLKPQNILMDAQNRAKLCDFGFARNMSTGTHVLTSIKGTPLYMAPELIKELPYDHNVDLWSLGCIIYELLVGAPPFCTTSILHLIRLITLEQIQWPTLLSDECISFLKGLLQKNPAKRLSWNEILIHPFVKGHILILEEGAAMPLTRVMSENTLQVKEQQRKDLERNRNKNSDIKEESQDVTNNNLVLDEQMQKMSLDTSNSLDISTNKTAGIPESKLSFIEDKHPIETEEWIAFLQKSMEEVISGDISSLTQPNLTVILSPLRNSNSDPKVLSYVAKLLSIPFVIRGIPEETLKQIKKVYLDVKLVPNLVYSSKLLLRVKQEEVSRTPSAASSIGITVDRYKQVLDLTEGELQSLEYIYMLITHLVHSEKAFLSQLCDAIVILNVYSLLALFLSICKSKLQVVIDLISVLTHLLRVFPENSELVEKILISNESSCKDFSARNCVNFVELLRHNDPVLRERACFFLLFLGKLLSCDKMAIIWSETVRETLEALMYDSIESVRNAADRTVEELKNKEFYMKSASSMINL